MEIEPVYLGRACKLIFFQASQNLERVRSILRTPSRKFSNDPAQVAAGTHMSPPPTSTLQKALPAIPATAPVKKQVNFTNSTLQRADDNQLGKSPSPIKFRAGSEVPTTGAVLYPSLAGFEMPSLEQGAAEPSPVRRLTFGGDAPPNQPRSFSFESGKPVNFGMSQVSFIYFPPNTTQVPPPPAPSARSARAMPRFSSRVRSASLLPCRSHRTRKTTNPPRRTCDQRRRCVIRPLHPRRRRPTRANCLDAPQAALSASLGLRTWLRLSAEVRLERRCQQLFCRTSQRILTTLYTIHDFLAS